MAKITATAKYGAPENPTFKDSTGWTVTLRYQSRRMTVPFYMGMALTNEPTAADVMTCLASDAASYENADSFEAWASEFGYDIDSRSAEKIYQACEKITAKLRTFLGDDFDRIVYSDEDTITKACA